MPPTPNLVKRESSGDDYESDDGRAWSDSFNTFRLERAYSSSSASAASGLASPSGSSFTGILEQNPGPTNFFPLSPSFNPTFAPPARTDSPASFNQGPGFARGHNIVTSMDRGSGGFANEEGEETPIGRVAASFAPGHGLDMRGASTSAASTSFGMLAPPSARQRTSSVPETGIQDSSMGAAAAAMHDAAWASHPMAAAGPGPSSSGFTQRAASMQINPGEQMMDNAYSPFRQSEQSEGSSPFGSSKQGAGNMQTQTQTQSAPVRPTLFTSTLDLTGWLDEPVVPCEFGHGLVLFARPSRSAC